MVFSLLGYEATSLSNWFTTFRSNVIILSSKFGNLEFSSDAASYPRGADTQSKGTEYLAEENNRL